MENKNLPSNYSDFHMAEYDSLKVSFNVISPEIFNDKYSGASSFRVITAGKRHYIADSIYASYDSLYCYNDSSYVLDMKEITGVNVEYGFRPVKFFTSTIAFAATGAFIALVSPENYSIGWFAAGGFAAGIPYGLKNSEFVLMGNYKLLE